MSPENAQKTTDTDMSNETDAINEQANSETNNQDTPPTYRSTDIDELHAIITQLETNNSDLSEKLDKITRAYADAENRAKRADKDRLDAIKFGPMKMARDILDVADNFERALQAYPETEDNNLKEVLEGLQLTEKSLHQVLSRFDVNPIDTTNAKFDPNFHEAVTQVPMPDKQSGDILDVVRKGYTMGERLLRPAQVVTVA